MIFFKLILDTISYSIPTVTYVWRICWIIRVSGRKIPLDAGYNGPTYITCYRDLIIAEMGVSFQANSSYYSGHEQKAVIVSGCLVSSENCVPFLLFVLQGNYWSFVLSFTFMAWGPPNRSILNCLMFFYYSLHHLSHYKTTLKFRGLGH